MTNEDPTTPELVAQADATAREALVRAEAFAALGAAGCVYPDLYAPAIAKELSAIHVSDDVGLAVFAVDARGTVRTGPKGPMTAADVVERWRTETPEMFRNKR